MKDNKFYCRVSSINLPKGFKEYVDWTVQQKDRVGSSLGSKDPNIGRIAGGVYEEIAEVSLAVLVKNPTMANVNRIHIRKETLVSCFRALDNYACATMWTCFQR